MPRLGVDPDRGGTRARFDAQEVERRRRASGLADVLDTLRASLRSTVEGSELFLMAVADADGSLLWREGGAAPARVADSHGFTVGACCAEESLGTNGIGTALAARRPLQVDAREHFVRAYRSWTCASAPLHDPRTGRLMGAVALSARVARCHPHTLALVAAAARLAEAELRAAHLESLDRLRTMAAPALARMSGPAVVVDRNGWTATATGVVPDRRLPLPRDVAGSQVWLPSLGECALEPFGGGWLVRPRSAGTADGAATTAVAVLDLSRPGRPALSLRGGSGTWSHLLTPRHAEVLLVLAAHPEGRSAAQLSQDLFGAPDRSVTVRAELSRLRRHLGGVLEHRPYRFAAGIDVQVRLPGSPLDLLPYSGAPGVRALRSLPQRLPCAVSQTAAHATPDEDPAAPGDGAAEAPVSPRSAAGGPRPTAGG